MRVMSSVSSGLAGELRELHPRQLEAVVHDGNVVVKAGPGSGKTRTLAARVAYVLETQYSPFRGVACITYTNAAAEEIARRVGHFGVTLRDRLACSTLHSFCLKEILRPYGSLGGRVAPGAGSIIDERTAVELLQTAFDEARISEMTAQYRLPHITRIRRDVAVGADLTAFDPREVTASRLFDEALRERGLFDFEALVIEALRIVQSIPEVRSLLKAKFPEIAVDEYQDLGRVLHALVLSLRDDADIRVFAVGDGDQSVFGFTGADPLFMRELEERADFRSIELLVNYRSGQDIIRASEAALGKSLGRRAISGAAPGHVELRAVQGSLDAHAEESAARVSQLLADGVPAERIAVLYPAKGRIVEELVDTFVQREIPLFHERDISLPKGSLSKLIQGCASRTLLLSQARKNREAGLSARLLLARSDAPAMFKLERDLVTLRRESGMREPRSRLQVIRSLQSGLDCSPPLTGDTLASGWLDHLIDVLELRAVAEAHPDQENAEGLPELMDLAAKGELALQDLAARVEVIGKVLLTTYHSAKGREFSAVVLPGLVNGLIPRDVNEKGKWRRANPSELAEQRRAFYVAVSRAEDSVLLIVGPGYHTPNGYWIHKGPSDFVVDMAALLKK